MFLYKNLFFFNIFYSFNPNHAYRNQWRLFSGSLPGMLIIDISLTRAELRFIKMKHFKKTNSVGILNKKSSKWMTIWKSSKYPPNNKPRQLQEKKTITLQTSERFKIKF